jgi:uncharacterized membrane protein (UPF0127 family)
MGAGCQKPASTATPPPPPMTATNLPHLDHAQPKLPTLKLWLGAQELAAELALNETQWSTGMMFRTNLLENEAMLFVFPYPHQARFFMKNTVIPLSCAYIDSDGAILELHDMKPLDLTTIDAASDKVQYVLETRQGWFARNNVGVGTIIRTERGSLREVFFGQ